MRRIMLVLDEVSIRYFPGTYIALIVSRFILGTWREIVQLFLKLRELYYGHCVQEKYWSHGVGLELSYR